MRSSSVVHAPGQLGGLALVAGGAVAAGQLVELRRAAGRRRGRSGARRCRSSAVVAVAVEAQVQLDQPARRRRSRRSGSAGPACAPRPCGRRPPRGGGTTRRPGRRSGSWACRCRGGGRPGAGSVSGLVFSTTAMVWASTSLWRWIGSCSRARAGQLGQELLGQAGVDQEPEARRPGRSTTSSLSSSSRMRSAETISSRPRQRRRRRRPARASGTRP